MRTVPYIKHALKAGGVIGILLLSYYLIELIFSRQRDASQQASVDASALIFIVYAFTCLYLAFIICFSTQYKKLTTKILSNSPIKWFLLYSIWGGVTSLWSTSLPMTAYRSIECIGMLLIMIAVAEQLVMKRGLSEMLMWSSVFVFFSILIRFLSYIRGGAEIGLNIGDGTVFNCAQMIAPIFFYLPLYIQTPRIIKYIICGFAIVSMSTVGYIGMTLGAISAFWSNKIVRAMAILATIILLALSFTYGAETILLKTIFADKTSVSFEETTGRDVIWLYGIERGMERPMVGWGFAAGERTLVEENDLMGVIGMHNCFMSAFVGCGLIGVTLMFLFWWSLLRTTFSRYIPKDIKPLFIALLAGAFIESFGNPGIGMRVYGSWIASTLVAVMISVVYVYNKYKFENNEDNLGN